MADRFPPPEIPKEITDALPQPGFQHASDWARTFAGSDTNLSQRAKHDADMAAFARQLVAQQEQHQIDVLAHDKGARDLFFKQEDLRRKQEIAAAKAILDAKKNAREDQLHQARLALMAQEAATSAAHEKATIAADALKAKHDQISAEDTAGLAQHMQQAGASPSSKAYADAALVGMVTFPNADKSLRSAILSQAKVQHTPEEIEAMAQKLPVDQRSQMRTTITDKGYSVVASTSPKLTPNATLIGYNSKVNQLGREHAAFQKQVAHANDPANNVSETDKIEAQALLNSKREELDAAKTERDNFIKSNATPLPGTPQPAAAPEETSPPRVTPPVKPIAPVSEDDQMKALAQQALDDPAATDAHKAAARAVLSNRGTPPATTPPPSASDSQ